MNKKKSLVIAMALAATVCIAYALIPKTAFGGSATTGDRPSGSNKAQSGAGAYGRATGATWFYYKNPENGGTASKVPGKPVSLRGVKLQTDVDQRCAEYEGFFALVRLAHPTGGNNNPTGQAATYWTLNEISGYGGYYVQKELGNMPGVTLFDSGASLNGATLVVGSSGNADNPVSGMSWIEVEKAFHNNVSEEEQARHPWRYGSDLSTFCYGEKESKNKLYSQSRADIPERSFTTEDTGLDGKVSKSAGEVEPEEEVTIVFTHYLDMDVPIPTEIYEQEFSFEVKGVNNEPSDESTGIFAEHTGRSQIQYNDWTEEVPSLGKISRTPYARGGIYQDTQTITIPAELKENDEYKVCQSIYYTPKEFKFKDEKNGTITYTNTGGGSSEACVTFKVCPIGKCCSDNCETQSDICRELPYDHTWYKGNSNAFSGVRNMSSRKYAAWATTKPNRKEVFVYARPGDSVQFEHGLCVGHNMVRTSDERFIDGPNDYPRPVVDEWVFPQTNYYIKENETDWYCRDWWDPWCYGYDRIYVYKWYWWDSFSGERFMGTSNNRYTPPSNLSSFNYRYNTNYFRFRNPVLKEGSTGVTTLGGPIPLTWFKITGKPNTRYNFGAATIVEGSPSIVATAGPSQKVELDVFRYNNGKGSIPVARDDKYNFNNFIDADVKEYNAFLVYSPTFGKAGTGSHTRDYICNYLDYAGLHISPGYQIPGFDSVRNRCVSSTKTRASDVGQVISQDLEWNNVRTWVSDTHRNTGSCSCAPSNTGKIENTWGVSYDQANGSGIRISETKVQGRCTGICCSCCSCSDCDCTPKSGFTDKGGSYRYASNDDLGQAPTRTASVKIPYNYISSVTSEIDAGEVIYTGETVESTMHWGVEPRKNLNIDTVERRNTYATITPDDTEVRVIEFVVDSEIENGVEMAKGNNNTEKDPCRYFRDRFGANNMISCDTLDSVIEAKNGDGLYKGDSGSYHYERLVPDNVEIGSTYCVAIGFYHTDSFGDPNLEVIPAGDDGLSLSTTSPNWNVSGASCRTIAKKPNFQVWGAGTYTNGGINTAITSKFNGTGLGDVPASNSGRTIFGSWDEYEVIAGLPVYGFASAASLGYEREKHELDLVGGRRYTNTFCTFTNMTIDKSTCNGVNGYGGWADVYLSLTSFLAPFSTRYYPPVEDGGPDVVTNSTATKPLDEGTEYVSVDKSISVNSIARRADSKTLIISSTKAININGNICYGSGTCSTSTANNLTLGQRNSTLFTDTATQLADIATLPQVIIIADEVNISQNVTQVDAWIIANQVNTCYDGGGVGTMSSQECNKTLYINGPVFAIDIELNRTAGAFPGAEHLMVGGGGTTRNMNYIYEGGGVLNQNLANDGSVTPGEIFNFRADSMFWAYNQAQRYSQATVTYSRELAPRY